MPFQLDGKCRNLKSLNILVQDEYLPEVLLQHCCRLYVALTAHGLHVLSRACDQYRIACSFNRGIYERK